MTTKTVTPSSSSADLNPSASIVDGVTRDNGGGREEGDIELALFRRIRSISNMSGRLTMTRQSDAPSWGYSRYFQHPLSMFSSNPSTPTSSEQDGHQQSTEHNSTNAAKDTDARSSSSHEQISSSESEGSNSLSNSTANKERQQLPTVVAWRDALTHACASMLGKTVDELRADYNVLISSTTPSTTTFSAQSTTFEPIPRDLADYAIISTLKHYDSSAMENAPSWLFNMMDRTGAGVILRDEFVRYAPFVGPIADFAVAGIVYDELLKEQIRVAREAEEEREKELSEEERKSKRHENRRKEQKQRKKGHGKSETEKSAQESNHTIQHGGDGRIGKAEERGHSVKKQSDLVIPDNTQNNVSSSSGLRLRKTLTHPPSNGSSTDSRSLFSSTHLEPNELNGVQSPALHDSSFRHSASNPVSMAEVGPANELLPPTVGLRFEIWRRFFHAVQDKYHYVDDEWLRVKRELGIDTDETLIKSQGALDHSDLFPTLGKLYLSQRYLIFVAAVGRNHYVVRLGAVADVSTDSIPLMMRDCVRISLESEVKVAMDGVSAVPKDTQASSINGSKEKGKAETDEKEDLTQSQHVEKLMKQFMGGRKPLTFSLLEFRETKRRDNWVNLIKEMVAAHKLHVQLGFGSSGRAVRNVHKRPRTGSTGAAGSVVGVAVNINENDNDDSDGDEDDDDDDETTRRNINTGIDRNGGKHVDNDGNGSKNGSPDRNEKNGADKDDRNLEKKKKEKKTLSLNYSRSPFRGEPSPPLLAVAAHSNIVRYRALRRVSRKRVSVHCGLLVFSHEQKNPALTNWYTDSVRVYQSQSGRTWIERALAAIRENMDTNERMYQVQDDEPFDIGKLGDAIGRFAELCAPLVRVIQFFDHLIQWRNPPATILAILVCIVIASNGLVHYVPAAVVGLQALWVVETKVNWLGLGMGGSRIEDAARRQQNVLELVAQVHDTLAAGQNVLAKLNRELGKIQSLFLWGCDHDMDSWLAVAALCVVSLVLLVVPTGTLFICFVFFLFFKHFLPPSNPVLRFWEVVPSRIEASRIAEKAKKAEARQKKLLLQQQRQLMERKAVSEKRT